MPKPALFAALALASAPTLAQLMRRQALPEGVDDLLCVFARREDDIIRLMAKLELDDRLAFIDCVDNYIQKIVLHPTGDSYRLLAGAQSSSRAELRGNMKLLLDGMHPDKAGGSWKASYAPRVIAAWREVSAGGVIAAAPPVAAGRQAQRQLAWIPRPIAEKTSVNASRRLAWLLMAAAALALLWRWVGSSLVAVAEGFAQ